MFLITKGIDMDIHMQNTILLKQNVAVARNYMVLPWYLEQFAEIELAQTKSRKDPNFAIKVESAIAEKYGVETVQHPQRDWNPEKEEDYLEQLKRDQIKAEFCEVNDIILVEIYDSDIINKSLFKKFDVTL